MTCAICCESYNKVVRKSTTCPFCDFGCCVSCLKQYFLGLANEPHCMSCNRGFLREHLVKLLPKSFIENEYKRHRENVLWEREKSMLPATQARLEIDLAKQKFTDAIVVLSQERNKLFEEYNAIKFDKIPQGTHGVRYLSRTPTPEETKRLPAIMSRVHTIYVEIMKLRAQRYRVGVAMGAEDQVSDEEKERRQFVKKCPGAECNGFLSSQWKCGLCDIKVCNKCFAIKDETQEKEHECDPEEVETAKHIMERTKPCPACGTRIMKSEGCSQMFCTHCHVAFDWRTLKIVTGVIHNPHYYEWQRAMNGGEAPRNPGDVPHCENIPHIVTCGHIWRKKGIDIELSTIFRKIHQLTIHIQYQEIAALPTEYNAAHNEDVRRRYLTKSIDLARLKWYLQKREKMSAKKRELRQLYDMFVACCRDFLRQSIHEDTDDEDMDAMYGQFIALCKYFEEHSRKIHETYGGMVPKIVDLDDRYDTLTYFPKSAAGEARRTKKRTTTDADDAAEAADTTPDGVFNQDPQDLRHPRHPRHPQYLVESPSHTPIESTG